MSTDSTQNHQLSSYLDYLPAIFSEDRPDDSKELLGRFLLAFEQVLTGLNDIDDPGLEEILHGIRDPTDGAEHLAGVWRYFDTGVRSGDQNGQTPQLLPEHRRTPNDFLDWLAGWVALTLHHDLEEDELRREERQRRLIATAVLSYRSRGTKKGLEEILRTALSDDANKVKVDIFESHQFFQIGRTSILNFNTILGEPHFFVVRIEGIGSASEQDDVNARKLAAARSIARAIIEMNRPAHTHYKLYLIETDTDTELKPHPTDATVETTL